MITGLGGQMCGSEIAAKLASEEGPFEVSSAVLYGVAFVLAAWQYARNRSVLRLVGMTMTLWAMLRELDFQKRFTYRSVESIGFYARPIASWSEKLTAFLILLPFGLAGCYLMWTFLKRLPSAWQNREKWLSYPLGIVLLLLTSSMAEKIFRLYAVEEVCECGAALLVLLLVWETRVSANACARAKCVLAR